MALAVSIPALEAQDSSVTVTLAVPEFMQQIFTPELLSQFESANPGTKVKLVTGDFPSFPLPSEGLDAHLQEVETYVSSADVQYVSSTNLSVEATRAGYFLDLAPLTSADLTLNSDDFFPAAWQSVQWDGAVWMLPVSADVVALIYNKDAFDSAGLAYPSGLWTMDDLANAARALTQQDGSGNVTQPGLVVSENGIALLLRSLLGQGFYDSSVIPNMPTFNNPNLDSMLATLSDLISEGVVTTGFGGPGIEAPMRIGGNPRLLAFNGNTAAPAYSMLPGGKAGVDAQGFSVSSGTQHPEQAYALAKFLTQRPEIANTFFGATPARQSLVGVQGAPLDNGNGGGRGGGFAIAGNSPEVKALIDEALANPLPSPELRFGEYVTAALNKMSSEGLDAHGALQETEALAVSNVQAAADKRATLVVMVATPVPDMVLAPGQVSLKFGLISFVSPLPNRDEWDRLVQEFTASDPQVKEIVLDTSARNPQDFTQNYDCFYLPLNFVPQVDLSSVLNLDPYMDADPTFDGSDFVGNTLAQVQRDNKTWALPVNIQPEALKYDSLKFAQSGLPAPENGWTIDAFNDALKSLKVSPEDQAPFESQGPGGTYLLLLIAAYGGLPIDYRTSPPTVNFTDPATVNAIRQVLDLARNGYIKYEALAGGDVIIFGGAGGNDLTTIYTEALNGFGFRVRVRGGRGNANNGSTTAQSDLNNAYKMTTYPKGTQYTGATFTMGTAYISAISQNPDACYRWISTVARHPELFSAMPARRSLINDPTIAGTRSPDETAFYNGFDAILQDPNTIAFPSSFAGASPANSLLERWLNQVFDNYVLNDADLDSGLADAQTYAVGFLDCTAKIPPYDPAAENLLSYIRQYTDCASKVDPSAGALFG